MKTLIKSKNKKGFTLVELVIVIAVLAIIAAIAIPTVTNVINTANENTDKANAQTIELALKTAHAEAAAKTWEQDPDTITVADALSHTGVLDADNTLPDCKVKDNKWYYIAGGKIVAAKSAPTKGYELKTTYKVADVLSGIEPSKT